METTYYSNLGLRGEALHFNRYTLNFHENIELILTLFFIIYTQRINGYLQAGVVQELNWGNILFILDKYGR